MEWKTQILAIALLAVVSPYGVQGYVPLTVKDHYLSDVLLREIVDRMGKELIDQSDTYIDPMADIPSHLALMGRSSKDLEAEQLDYDALLDGNPHPSLRDQEFLQHSSLWGHQYISGGNGEEPHHTQPQVKTDTSLPAYCNPPNPCPFGYSEEHGCIDDFENTAAFSREYQAAQECMCDGEHMFDCPGQSDSDDNQQMPPDLESFLARQFHNAGNAGAAGDHKNMVAKKFHPPQRRRSDSNNNGGNPFLQGEKLPIAAKKGNNIY